MNGNDKARSLENALWKPSQKKVKAILQDLEKSCRNAPRNVREAAQRTASSDNPLQEDLAILLLWQCDQKQRPKRKKQTRKPKKPRKPEATGFTVQAEKEFQSRKSSPISRITRRLKRGRGTKKGTVFVKKD
jgi:hypothetical protein